MYRLDEQNLNWFREAVRSKDSRYQSILVGQVGESFDGDRFYHTVNGVRRRTVFTVRSYQHREKTLHLWPGWHKELARVEKIVASLEARQLKTWDDFSTIAKALSKRAMMTVTGLTSSGKRVWYQLRWGEYPKPGANRHPNDKMSMSIEWSDDQLSDCGRCFQSQEFVNKERYLRNVQERTWQARAMLNEVVCCHMEDVVRKVPRERMSPLFLFNINGRTYTYAKDDRNYDWTLTRREVTTFVF